MPVKWIFQQAVSATTEAELVYPKNFFHLGERLKNLLERLPFHFDKR
jgi:hypothetical protein